MAPANDTHEQAKPPVERWSRRAVDRLPSYRPLRGPLVSMGPSLDDQQRRIVRRRRLALMAVVVIAAVIAAVVVTRVLLAPAPVRETTAVSTPSAELTTGTPAPMQLARIEDEDLALQLPVARDAISAIGYDVIADRSVLPLDPSGRRANVSRVARYLERFLATEAPSTLRYYDLDDRGTANVVQVGALPGADVYAPVSGTVVAIAPYRVNDNVRGAVVQLQPLGDVETIVVVQGVDPAPSLAVGETVSEGLSLLGDVVRTSDVVEHPLADHTNDQGDNIAIYVRRVQPDTIL